MGLEDKREVLRRANEAKLALCPVWDVTETRMGRAERLRFRKLGHDFEFRLNRLVMLPDELIGIGPVGEFQLWFVRLPLEAGVEEMVGAMSAVDEAELREGIGQARVGVMRMLEAVLNASGEDMRVFREIGCMAGVRAALTLNEMEVGLGGGAGAGRMNSLVYEAHVLDFAALQVSQEWRWMREE